MISLYIHIPFCVRKCLYCDFNSYDNQMDLVQPYMEALGRELLSYEGMGEAYKTVFIGGGTPSVIEGEEIVRLMELLRPRLAEGAEVTIETNPGTLTMEKLNAYRRAGINRISMGVQAFQDELLGRLGRIHTVSQVEESCKLIQAAGFTNLNLDFMFALPGQTLAQWEESLRRGAELGASHISAYSLIIEEGTPFAKMAAQGELLEMDEDLDREMYHATKRILQDYGFHRYEISNFAKPSFESRHNQVYWHNEEYIGIGAGATSRLGDRRYSNVKGVREYIGRISAGASPIDEMERISNKDSMWETIFLALRLDEGLDIGAFERTYGVDFGAYYQKPLEKLQKNGLIRIEKGRLRLTEWGIDLSNQVFVAMDV